MKIVMNNINTLFRNIVIFILYAMCHGFMYASHENAFKEMKYINPMLESPRQWSIVDLESKGFVFKEIPNDVRYEFNVILNDCKYNKYKIQKNKNSIDCRIKIEFNGVNNCATMYLSMGLYYMSVDGSVFMIPRPVRARLIKLFSSAGWKKYLTLNGYEYPSKTR